MATIGGYRDDRPVFRRAETEVPGGRLALLGHSLVAHALDGTFTAALLCMLLLALNFAHYLWRYRRASKRLKLI